MTSYMLDTNIVSYLLRGQDRRLNEHYDRLSHVVVISCLTEAELLFGMARQPGATTLATAIRKFLKSVDILSWNSVAAAVYGTMKAQLQREGLALAPMDMLIAAHALAVDATLVTSDSAFYKAGHLLKLENWRAN